MSRTVSVSPSAGAELTARVHGSIRAHLTRHKLQRYASDCTRDVLLLSHGLRCSFVVDVFADCSVWRSLLQELRRLHAPQFDELAVLTLDADACFLLHVPSFRALMEAFLQSLAEERSSASSQAGIEIVLVHRSLPTPQLCTGPSRAIIRQQLLEVAQTLLQQLEQQRLVSDFELQLSSTPALCPTLLCGFLLGYPLLYCTRDPAAFTQDLPAAASSAAGNNLGAQPLLRTVLAADVRSDWPQASLAFLTSGKRLPSAAQGDEESSSSRTLVCSFTVPVALLEEESVKAALDGWKARQLAIQPLHAEKCCWQTPPLLSSQAVILSAVAL